MRQRIKPSYENIKREKERKSYSEVAEKEENGDWKKGRGRRITWESGGETSGIKEV